MPTPIHPSPAQPGPFGQARKARAETHRLFFALMPDDDVRQRIRQFAGRLQEQKPEFRARWVKPERFHATLNFVGDYPALPEEVVDAASVAASGLRALAFGWTLDYVASFRGREPPCIMRCTSVPALMLALWQDLGMALVQSGLHRRAERQYTPHVTLAYARHELSEPISIEPIPWHVDRFVLIHNVVGRGHYRILGEWPLLAGSTG